MTLRSRLGLVELIVAASFAALLVAVAAPLPTLANLALFLAFTYLAATACFAGIWYASGSRRAFCVGACPIVWLAVASSFYYLITLPIPPRAEWTGQIVDTLREMFRSRQYLWAEARIFTYVLFALVLGLISGMLTAIVHHLAAPATHDQGAAPVGKDDAHR